VLRWRERIGELVATPSISSVRPELTQGNRAVLDRLAGWLEDAGWRVEILPIAGAKTSMDRNLVATLGAGEGGLVLSGHADTVPFDEGRWTSDPFVATERDGALFGLGVADMKSFFAFAIEAAERVGRQRLRRPLTLIATADEECDMTGAHALVALQRTFGAHAIIGEPTNLAPVRAHKGITMEFVRLTGRSGHSSDPERGANALEGMRRVMNVLAAERDALMANGARHAELSPSFSTLNLGSIRGGDAPNRICADAELLYDLRVVPGANLDEIRGRIRDEVERSIAGLGLALAMGPLHEPVPAFETAADADVVMAIERMTGARAGSVSFATEAPYLSAMGLSTVVWGPGDIAVAHQPDEHLPLDRAMPYIDMLARAIEHFCGPEAS
jgi:acetylornithine deacetylase